MAGQDLASDSAVDLAAPAHSPKRQSPVPAWVPDLPAAPGVYEFIDEAGTTLYVGKSVNLRQRVRSHFYGGARVGERLGEMLALSRGVRFQPAGTDLEAQLTEAERIIRERPPYNRALKRRATGWYLHVRWRDPFPRFRLAGRVGPAGSTSFGPFAGKHLPDRIRRLCEKLFRLRNCAGQITPARGHTPCVQFDLGLCTAPCAARVGVARYRSQARKASRFLSEREFGWEIRDRLERARDAAARALDYERAAAMQLRLKWLTELEELRWALDAEVPNRSWLILLPAADGAGYVLLPVAAGRLLRMRRPSGPVEALRTVFEDACYAVGVAELRATRPTGLEAVTSSIVRRWLEEGCPGGEAVNIDTQRPGLAVETALALTA